MVIFGNGYGGAKTLGGGSIPEVAAGHVLASNEDGTALSGSKEGRRGYNRQRPNKLKVV